MSPLPNVAYFFVSLPERLAVPDGWIIRLVEMADGSRVGAPFQTEDGLDRKIVGSLLFRQIDDEARGNPVIFARPAFIAAAKAFAGSDADINPEDAQIPSEAHEKIVPQATASTVVEVAVLCETDVDITELEEAFNYGLEQIRGIQQMYYLVSQTPVTLVTRETLPMAIPVAITAMTLGESCELRPSSQPSHFTFLINDVSSSLTCIAPSDELPEEKLQQMTLDVRLWPGPFATYANFRRETSIAQRDGNRLTASVLNGAAAEALLRELHLAIMWDEGLEPKEAVREMRAMRSVTRLAKGAFHNRLGGNWTLDGKGPVSEWKRHVADLRDQIVHMGYEPNAAEVRRSLDATYHLERYVSDRLTGVVDKYPFATVFLRGHDRIRNLSKTRHLAWERGTQSFFGSDPVEAFKVWRYEVERFLAPDMPTVGDTTRGKLVRVDYINGETRYWLADEETGLACLARPPDDVTLRAIEPFDVEDTAVERSIAIMHVEPVPADRRSRWFPLREVIPSIPYRRFASCLVPPT